MNSSSNLAGASGVKICAQCVGTGRNIPGCVSVDCMDSAKWTMISDDQLWSMVDRISRAASTSTKADFARWIDGIICKFLLVGIFFRFLFFPFGNTMRFTKVGKGHWHHV